MILPKVPKRWSIRGEIPNVDPSQVDAELDQLDEDLLQIKDATGQFTIDIGWYPAASRDGQFICRIIADEIWERPLESAEIRSRDAIRQWMKHAIDNVQLRAGQPGEFTKKVGLFIYVKFMKSTKVASGRRLKPPAVVPSYSTSVASNNDTELRLDQSAPEITNPNSTASRPYQSAVSYAT